MLNFDRSFRVEYGISIDDKVGIFQGDPHPSSLDVDSPVGSLYCRTNGELYQKINTTINDWVLFSATGGLADYYNGSIVTLIDYNASNKTTILVDTTNNDVDIFLPDIALTTPNKIFNVKWWAGTNRATVFGYDSHLIDHESSHIIGCLLDSLMFTAVTSTDWAII